MIETCEATYDESASAVLIHLVGGPHAEQWAEPRRSNRRARQEPRVELVVEQ
jgi:hypothetical protein